MFSFGGLSVTVEQLDMVQRLAGIYGAMADPVALREAGLRLKADWENADRARLAALEGQRELAAATAQQERRAAELEAKAQELEARSRRLDERAAAIEAAQQKLYEIRDQLRNAA
jgi:hypothetical protein